MATAARHLLYDGIVFERVGTLKESGLEDGRESGLVATDDLLVRGEVLKDGDPVPASPYFQRDPKEVSVRLPESGDDHLIERGLARRTRDGE